MKTILIKLEAVAVAFIVTGSLLAQEEAQTAAKSTSSHVMLREADLHWGDAPPALPAGAKMAVLQGDPAAAGPFILRLKVPAGYKIPLHTHPTDEIVTVLTGSVDFKMGSATSAAETFPAGGFLVMPAGMQHAASATTEAVLQVSSQGPFVINYVDPKDDPRQAK
jgi:quercetin dioxygenase-like cupin family protein